MRLAHQTPSLIDLCLLICSLKQAFNRRTTQKESHLKQAMGFLSNYMEKRMKTQSPSGREKLEVKYNLARTMHYLG